MGIEKLKIFKNEKVLVETALDLVSTNATSQAVVKNIKIDYSEQATGSGNTLGYMRNYGNFLYSLVHGDKSIQAAVNSSFSSSTV